MADATAADYAWFEEKYGDSLWVSGFCLTFVRGLSPEEAFARIGVPGTPWNPPEGTAPDPHSAPGIVSHPAVAASGYPTAPDVAADGRPIAAYAAVGGTVLLEDGGRAGTLAEVTRRLSAGTVTAAVHLDARDGRQFVFAADGQVVAGYEPGLPTAPWGASPGLLPSPDGEAAAPAGDLADVPPADLAVLSAIALAERVTGVRLTWRHLARPALTGSAAHLY
ncbi:hypothetical protein Skr01_64370 [Sphaerisporangium krabiense]|uniref:Uncharacterized protein n=1 Tax=Sphaerisporangium krabiense TaxID=763782 RepID=A0A7W8Z6F7_9ACTN|nr:DUF6461 domain-containing protein [Sphaerisporangium krabiense]MBB5628353.1 hypothetical protein [Sphaerisporangium krabiense]GII66352.1 hypothetical protein Skr01_64370 [Sphaerisporangium krabiense]